MGTNLWECGILVGWSVGSDSESLQRVQFKSFYRTQVSLGSVLWVPVSLTTYIQELWLRLC